MIRSRQEEGLSVKSAGVQCFVRRTSRNTTSALISASRSIRPKGAVPGEDLLGKALASGGQANAMIPNPGKTFTHRWGNTSETLAFERHS